LRGLKGVKYAAGELREAIARDAATMRKAGLPDLLPA
jgi:hypothetical protein